MQSFDVDTIPRRLLAVLVLTGTLAPEAATSQVRADRGNPAPGTTRQEAEPRYDESEARQHLERQVVTAFTEDRPEDALRLLDTAIQRWPKDAGLHYARACALSLLERRDAAGEALIVAVRHGFRDFEAMRLDPALRSMRNHEVFQAILEAAARRGSSGERGKSGIGSEAQLDEAWLRRRFDDDYHLETIEDLKIRLACGLPRRSCTEMQTMLARQSAYQLAALFDAARLDWCTVIVPAARDQSRGFREQLGLEDPERTPGAYRHDRRLLVSRDIGSSMRHEYTHRLHWADMESRGQRHPMWIQEGLASLFEDYEWDNGGRPRFTPNLRHAIVHRQVTSGRDVDFVDLLAMDADTFAEDRAVLYPQARSVFEFIADRGRLEDWYRTYVSTHATDPSGRRAIERTFGSSIEQFNESWKQWVLARGRQDATLEAGDPYPGILVEDAGDGVRIRRLVTREARRAGLRIGDVVMKIDDHEVRTRAEWYLVLSEHRLGDLVRLECRRAGGVRAARIRLHPFGSR